MKICLYTETALPMLGGQEFVVDALAREFIRAGHEAVVLAPTPRAPHRAEDTQFPYRVFRHPRFISTRRLVGCYRWWLKSLYRRFPFDILHCHSVYPTGYVAARLRPPLRVPIVITSHGGDLAPENPRLREPRILERYRLAAHEADALVAISTFTRKGFLELASTASKIESIPNGVHLAEFRQAAARPASLAGEIQPHDYILFLGRLHRRKGVDILLQAFALLPSAPRPYLVIAGDGEERGALEQQARKLGIEHHVRFVGRIVGADKIHLLQNAIATVLPSRGWEAFPLVILESYAAGRPLIAVKIPGVDELVSAGETGWLVEPESPSALAEAMAAALNDRARTDQLGRNARQRAANYDWNIVAERYLRLFSELLDRRNAHL